VRTVEKDHSAWIVALIVAAVVLGATLMGNYNRNHVSGGYHPAPATYSVGTICFDDGAGGISNPEACLP
jgi:hypothetical protein